MTKGETASLALPTQVGIHSGRGQIPAAMDPDLRQQSGMVGTFSAMGPRIKFEGALGQQEFRFNRTKSLVGNVCFWSKRDIRRATILGRI